MLAGTSEHEQSALLQRIWAAFILRSSRHLCLCQGTVGLRTSCRAGEHGERQDCDILKLCLLRAGTWRCVLVHEKALEAFKCRSTCFPAGHLARVRCHFETKAPF